MFCCSLDKCIIGNDIKLSFRSIENKLQCHSHFAFCFHMFGLHWFLFTFITLFTVIINHINLKANVLCTVTHQLKLITSQSKERAYFVVMPKVCILRNVISGNWILLKTKHKWSISCEFINNLPRYYLKCGRWIGQSQQRLVILFIYIYVYKIEWHFVLKDFNQFTAT